MKRGEERKMRGDEMRGDTTGDTQRKGEKRKKRKERKKRKKDSLACSASFTVKMKNLSRVPSIKRSRKKKKTQIVK